MKFISHFIFLILLSLSFLSCATGAGTSEGSTGSAALSLQLAELEAGQNYLTQDGFALDFSTFACAFSAITLGSETVAQQFTADFFDEEVADIVAIEDVAAGDYDTLTLTLGPASGLTGLVKLSAVREASQGNEVSSDLNGLSCLFVAQAAKDGQSCTLRSELESMAALTVTGEDIEVEAGQESEILVQVDPNAIFGTIDLPDGCSGGATLTLSESENAALAQAALDNLIGNQAFELVTTGGHSHAH